VVLVPATGQAQERENTVKTLTEIRDAIVAHFGNSAMYSENEAWLDGQVKGLILWRVFAMKPEGTVTEYYNFVSTLGVAEAYLGAMKRSN